ncbi:hypothetical protein ACVSQB_35230 [Bradyrhizobium elkanii]
MGGAVLALVTHVMIPVGLEGGSLVALPMVAGFLFVLSPSLSFELTSTMVSSGIAAAGIGLHNTLAKPNDA